ncbi:zinc finger protein 35-like isoform X3 [Poeciliopsis prolifica]|uniref:zinc finger protein 35-like isoform X3 n=1 Tax=Poeciliopsis prolifica TaxID=188132 RepID=UPI002413F044|nr:zinc finger protein 35-like isoform X3 [Poeciliopsis prolifica]
MSSLSSQREFTNAPSPPAEETLPDIKEIIVKSEEEIDDSLDFSEKTQLVVKRTDLQHHDVKKEEDFSGQEEPQSLTMKEEQGELQHLQIKEEENELCITQDEEQLVVKKQEMKTFPASPTDVEISCSEPKLIMEQLISQDGCDAENRNQEESNDEDTEISSDEEPKQNNKRQKTRGYDNNSGKLKQKEQKKTHKDKNLYSCTMCDKLFSQKTHLIYHMRTHTALSLSTRLSDSIGSHFAT